MPPTPVDQLPMTVPVFHILLSLVDHPLHGYALIQDIRSRTDGEVALTASTLYGAVARLLAGGLIDEVESASGLERRRQYRITRRGKALLADEAMRLDRATQWAREKRVLRRES